MVNKVLIVEDSPLTRAIIKKNILSVHQCEIEFAENGQEGVEKYQEFHPDLVFLDLNMPVMDGKECIRQIKELDVKAMILACTAQVDQATIEEVKQLGALGLVKKPPNHDVIKMAIEKIEQLQKSCLP